jgi:hypothetical protein
MKTAPRVILIATLLVLSIVAVLPPRRALVILSGIPAYQSD